jgi:pimeloyl-ACP methyl ester carboxylesterase
VNALMPRVARLYTEYLIDGQSPRTIVAREPQLQSIWPEGRDLDHLYGRPISYYQQLQRLNLAKAWLDVRRPVLILRGEYDWIMSRDDSETIAAIVNQNSPGAAQLVEIPDAGHALDHYESLQGAFGSPALPFESAIGVQIAQWLENRLGQMENR